MKTENKAPSIVNSAKTVLMASAVSMALAGAVMFQPGVSSLAFAEAVKLEAPQAPGFADVVEAVSPAVVSVRVEAEVEAAVEREGFPFDRRFNNRENRRDRWFQRGPRSDRGERRGGPRRFGISQGSGFFVSEDGYVVTNNHVIENGSKFTIVMDDGTELEAALVGTDPRTDLAVLKVEEDRKFTYVAFGENDPRVGDWVVAVGNPFGLGGTVTAGIVSANGREIGNNRYDDFIQIDAAVNKGNSGGPAFNLAGEVIGVNTAIFSPSGGNVGIAFAIPAPTAKAIVEDLIDDGQVVRGWLGVQIQPVSAEIAETLGLDNASGAIVSVPQADSPAEEAGIRSGDVILEVAGETVKDPKTLARLIGSYDPESEVKLTIWRDGKRQDLEVKLGKLEGPQLASLPTEAPSVGPAVQEDLGLQLESGPDGLVVSDLEPQGNAIKRGIRPGDVIRSVNGENVASVSDLDAAVAEAKKLGRGAVLLQMERQGRVSFVPVPVTAG